MEKKIKVITTIILIIAILNTYINISSAANKKDLENESSNLSNAISEAKENLENIREEKGETQSEVNSLTEKIADFQDEISELSSKIYNLENKINDAEKQIKKDEEEHKQQQQALDERLVTMYENGEVTYLDFLLSSNSLTDFISSYHLITEIAKYDTEMLEKIEEDKKKIETEKAELEESKASLDNAKKTKESKAQALKVAKSEKEQKVKKLSASEQSTQKEIDEMIEDKAIIEKQLQKIAAEEARKLEEARKAAEEAAKKKAAEEAARKKAEENAKKNNTSKNNTNSNTNSTNGGGTTYTPPSTSGYIFPVAGCSRANINNLTYPSYSGHTGIDVNINVTGKSVVAVKSGTVATSTAVKNANGTYRSYGEYIIITHGDGTATLYAHLLAGSRRVSPGDKVSQGQVIGTVGSTRKFNGYSFAF